MKTSLSSFLTGLLATSLTVSAASAKDDELPDHKLSEFKLGEVVSGDKAAAKNLDGKVVALEMWGFR